MTREELIAYGEDYLKDLISAACEISEKHKEFVKMAIEALKAEPCEDAVSRDAVIEITAETGALETQARVKALPPVTSKQRTGIDCVLDRIVSEINELYYSYVKFDEGIKTSFNMVRLEEVQRVIDKYKAESEKINCKTTKCENCINHNYCDYEQQESEDKNEDDRRN